MLRCRFKQSCTLKGLLGQRQTKKQQFVLADMRDLYATISKCGLKKCADEGTVYSTVLYDMTPVTGVEPEHDFEIML